MKFRILSDGYFTPTRHFFFRALLSPHPFFIFSPSSSSSSPTPLNSFFYCVPNTHKRTVTGGNLQNQSRPIVDVWITLQSVFFPPLSSPLETNVTDYQRYYHQTVVINPKTIRGNSNAGFDVGLRNYVQFFYYYLYARREWVNFKMAAIFTVLVTSPID